jgi:hypothetical protein
MCTIYPAGLDHFPSIFRTTDRDFRNNKQISCVFELEIAFLLDVVAFGGLGQEHGGLPDGNSGRTNDFGKVLIISLSSLEFKFNQ